MIDLVRYRSAAVVARHTGAPQELVASFGDGRKTVVPASTVALLSKCNAFRTLEEHARRICRGARLEPARAAAVHRNLESLAEAGFLTSQDDVLDRCRSGATAEAPAAPIAVLGVPSCERTDVLTRCLRSYMRNTREHGRDVEFVLIDDSRSVASRAANLAALSALSREYGTRASYASAVEREAYACALARESGVPLDTVRFALLNTQDDLVSTGACRNALLLHSVGDRFIHVDDDTICHVASVQNAQRGLALASVHVGMEHAFFETGEEARAAVSFTAQDYVGLYEPLLGRCVADVLSGAAPDETIDLDLAGPEFVRQLETAPCRIAVASVGVVGDSGMGTTEMYFFIADQASRARLHRFPGGYRRAFQSLEIIRATARTTIAQTGLCMGIGLGLDGRGLLPPFMPVLRNSDGMFSTVRRACFPATSMAFLPWLVEHRPPAPRRSSFEEVLQRAGGVGFSAFLSWFVKAFDPPTAMEAPDRRMAALGRHLIDIGSLPAGDYRGQCRQILQARVDEMCQYVETFDARCGDGPDGWREDLAAYLTAARATVGAVDGIVPRDLIRSGASASEAVVRGQRLVTQYGDLLCAWPAMVQAARTLRHGGQRPARSLS